MNKSRSVMRREVEQRGEQIQQIDCINQQARDCGLTKRSQAERLAIADSLIASVWEEYLNGSIDRGTLQVAAYIQANANRIVWKLNELNNPNTPKALEALDCISRKEAIDALGERPTVWTTDDEYTLGARNQYDMDKLAIETVLSAQPERKKGKWIPDNNNYYEERFICSVCGKSYKVDTCMGKPMWEFCPCGADMRGE